MFTSSCGSVLDSCVSPKKEPEFAATDGGGAGDDYACNIGIDTDGCYDCGSPKEEPESKIIDVYHHHIKEEPELGDGYGDDVNDDYECDPPKDEPELVATGDDTDADSGAYVCYDCSHCGISLSTEKLKVEHELRCKVVMERKELESQVMKLYRCGYCRCPFIAKELKEEHQQKYCRKRPVGKGRQKDDPYFGCDECEYVTKRKGNLEAHVLTHNKNNGEWFSCTLCSYKTVRKYDVIRHTKIHSSTFCYCCPVCGKSFRRKPYLDDHLLKQHSDGSDEVAELITSKIYTCNICDRYRTTLKTNFNDHVAIIHHKGVGRQKYECPRCPYSTFRKMNLKRHSKTHVERKDYRCTGCQKQFARKMELDSHILYNHADNVDLVKTVTSKLHCCKSCSFKTAVKTHLKTHVQSKHI